jgi:hypothetical protein
MRRMAFFISEDLEAGLKALKEEYGTPEAETIRRALTEYLSEKGVLPRATTKTPVRKLKRRP